MKTVCSLCPHHCQLEPGQSGLCQARRNKNGKIICDNYGRLAALALDPIEKKPLRRFYPGNWILSVGSYGCNLRCPFCQNYKISMEGKKSETIFLSPKDLVKRAMNLTEKARGNLGIAFTYNEPLIGYEYVYDCAELAHQVGLKTVIVTNGMICEEPLLKLLPLTDAMNIDLKGFTQQYYDWVGGDLETVKNTIAVSASQCHVEVTTLIIPGKNDRTEGMNAEAKWIASLNPEIPLHISRFFPCWHVPGQEPTPVQTISSLCREAKEHLQYVYAGNC